MPCGWEGNRKSGVAAAMRHIRPTLVTVRCLLKAGLRAICSAAVSYFIFIFKDAYQTSYLKMYRTDLSRRVIRFGHRWLVGN